MPRERWNVCNIYEGELVLNPDRRSLSNYFMESNYVAVTLEYCSIDGKNFVFLMNAYGRRALSGLEPL